MRKSKIGALKSSTKDEIIEWTIHFLNDALFVSGKYDGRTPGPKDIENLLKLLNRDLPDGLIKTSKGTIDVK